MAIPPFRRIAPLALLVAAALPRPAAAQAAAAPPLDSLKRVAVLEVQQRAGLVQRIVDQLFSYGELGYQEVETSRYLVDLLRREGFTVDTGVAGMPTAWVARWGRGRPVLALGSDIDGIPQASQVPGVACRMPIVPGAPGHGEGHNSGQAVNIAAALAVKKIMERDKLPGTLMLWPGVAEEQLGGKPHLVRAGVFRDVDVGALLPRRHRARHVLGTDVGIGRRLRPVQLSWHAGPRRAPARGPGAARSMRSS